MVLDGLYVQVLMAAQVLLALLGDVANFRFTRISGMHGRSVVGKHLEGYPYRKHALGIRSVGVAPFLLGVFAVFAVCDLSLAEDRKSCEQRRDEIAHEREQAIRYGNIYQQRGLEANVINLSPQPWPGQEIPGLGRAVAAVPSLVLLPSSAHVRPRRQLNGCRFASAGGISRFPGERVPAAVWPAFLRCSSGAACS